ncbi:hypothetical protein Y032_0309g2087 [Ancylostoma ceylanicum]|uniref:Uncharacterized protein n=1 Tax=Ancylostoma ceylanicum TaxID=53326 RepID=A0A016S2W2_9BILA|nr:hypothetical protein Y032_0309g2087 [Ancylostoma ceylanicum]
MGLGMLLPVKTVRVDLCDWPGNLYQTDARIHLWKMFYGDQSPRHVILNEKNARLLRSFVMRLRCDWPYSSSHRRMHVSRMHLV